jgi:PRTRC genetic system protein A
MNTPMDAILQEQFPTVMVPRYGDFVPLAHNGRRFLSASDGLWLEEKNQWLHVLWPLALQNQVAMPYGSLQKKVDFLYGEFPVDMIARFMVEAKERFPLECAAWFTWDTSLKRFNYYSLHARQASLDNLDYACPVLPETECLVCDIHSHGRHPAVFSPEDNKDDRGETKIAVVLGRINSSPSIAFRLCVAGLKIPIKYNLAKLPFMEET